MRGHEKPGVRDNTPKTNELADYDTYVMPPGRKLFYVMLAVPAVYALAFLFYRSHMLSLLITPAALFYPGIKRKAIIRRRKKELNLQFKDMLYSLSSSLAAGKPVELAFRDVSRDLSVIYPDPDTDIIREVRYITARLELNESIETALSDFALRSHTDDIENFAEVFRTCKRSGGNIIDVIRNTSAIINDRIEIRQEIDTMLSERKFERKLLNVMPILMMLLLSLSAGDYIKPVFTTAAGRIVMTVSIVLLAAAYFLSGKIMNIEV